MIFFPSQLGEDGILVTFFIHFYKSILSVSVLILSIVNVIAKIVSQK